MHRATFFVQRSTLAILINVISTRVFSNILCATPTAPGQGNVPAGVESVLTGFYSGKGGNRTFSSTGSFSQGDTVVFQGYVKDQNLAPVEGATMDLAITGPSSATVSSGSSDATGMFEGSWKTSSKKNGTPPGSYTAATTGVTATGYEWDTVPTSTTFTLE